MGKLYYTIEISQLEALGFSKNILADEGYDFYTKDLNGIEITVSILSDDMINVCLHNDGVSIPLLYCNTISKLQMLILATSWKE